LGQETFFEQAAAWLNKLAAFNRRRRLFSTLLFDSVLGELWFRLNYVAAGTEGLAAWHRWRASPFHHASRKSIAPRLRAQLALKAALRLSRER
jgi:hypothetical protein